MMHCCYNGQFAWVLQVFNTAFLYAFSAISANSVRPPARQILSEDFDRPNQGNPNADLYVHWWSYWKTDRC